MVSQPLRECVRAADQVGVSAGRREGSLAGIVRWEEAPPGTGL
jgi:hypothetical protein